MRNDILQFSHVEPGELADYFAFRLTANREREIEEHIAECADCAETGRSIHSGIFDVERLTAKDLGQAFAKQALESALMTAAERETRPNIRPLYGSWLRELGRNPTGLLRTIVRSSGAEFLIEGLSFGGWKIGPAYALRGLQPGDRGVGHTVVMKVPEAESDSRASVSRRGEAIVIEIRDWPAGRTPFVVLVDLGQSGLPIHGESSEIAEKQFEVRFHEVKPGPYLLLFRSFEKSEPLS